MKARMNQASAHSVSGPLRPEPSRGGSRRLESAIESARRHSGRVRFLKLALPFVAVLMAGLFFGQSYLASPATVAFSVDDTVIEGGRLVMSNPKLDGYTRDGRAYSMTAERAIQAIGEPSVIDLEGIDATLPTEDGRLAHVKSQSGTLDRNSNTLTFHSEVTVRTDDGMTAVMRSAFVDIGSGRITGDENVSVRYEGTKVDAETVEISEDGAVMVFERRVRVEIDGGQLRKVAGDDGAGDEN